jgi:hypothetical protein
MTATSAGVRPARVWSVVFVGPGRAWWWLAGYAVLLVASTIL